MAVTDDVKEAVATLKKITDAQDKIRSVQRDIVLMLAVTKFTDMGVRASIDRIVDGLSNAESGLSLAMVNTIKEIQRVQKGP